MKSYMGLRAAGACRESQLIRYFSPFKDRSCKADDIMFDNSVQYSTNHGQVITILFVSRKATSLFLDTYHHLHLFTQLRIHILLLLLFIYYYHLFRILASSHKLQIIPYKKPTPPWVLTITLYGRLPWLRHAKCCKHPDWSQGLVEEQVRDWSFGEIVLLPSVVYSSKRKRKKNLISPP